MKTVADGVGIPGAEAPYALGMATVRAPIGVPREGRSCRNLAVGIPESPSPTGGRLPMERL